MEPWLSELMNELLHPADAEPGRVLVVEDDEELRASLLRALAEQPFATDGAGTVAQALRLLGEKRHRVVLTDKNLPDASGLDLIRHGRRLVPEAEFIIMTAHASLESAIEAVNLGAFGYLPKPLTSWNEVVRRVLAAFEKRRVLKLNALLAKRLHDTTNELSRAQLELEMMGEVVDAKLRERSEELRLVLDALLEPLAVVEEDIATFAGFARAVAKGAPVAGQATAELGRLRILEDIVRRVTRQAQAAAEKLDPEKA